MLEKEHSPEVSVFCVFSVRVCNALIARTKTYKERNENIASYSATEWGKMKRIANNDHTINIIIELVMLLVKSERRHTSRAHTVIRSSLDFVQCA